MIPLSGPRSKSSEGPVLLEVCLLVRRIDPDPDSSWNLLLGFFLLSPFQLKAPGQNPQLKSSHSEVPPKPAGHLSVPFQVADRLDSLDSP